MKKLLGICICLLLTLAAIVPVVAFAADGAQDDGIAKDTTYFLNPTAIATVGDKLFVADKIQLNRSILFCYDISGEQPQLASSQEVDGYVTNLAAKDTDSLYAVFTDKITEYTVSNDSISDNQTWTVANPIDVTYGASGSTAIEYILNGNGIARRAESGYVKTFANGIACISIDESIYYAYKDGSKTNYVQYNGKNYNEPEENTLNNANKNSDITSFNTKGMFVWENDKIALFDDKTISCVEINRSSCDLATPLFSYTGSEDEISDVATYGGRLYILDKNKVEVYAQATDFRLVATIGSDKVQQRVPEVNEYTSFTLVRSYGYPTNIVFRTTEDSSIDSIQTDATEYIVIGYDGDASSGFYYVLLHDKFGWVKKSDNADSVNNDDRLEVIPTEWSNENVQYKSQFTSLNSVWIYDLPCSKFEPHVFTQQADNKTEVTILQQFDEATDKGTIAWLYVSYQDGETTKTGFVQNNAIGAVSTKVENTKVIAVRKINTALFSFIRLYKFPDPARMTDKYIATYTTTTTDDNGEQTVREHKVPKLYSGQRVSVISEENGIALVQIELKDKGVYVYGYVYSNQLIGQHQLSTNATVGLILVSVAIVLGVTLTVVFVNRSKRRKKAAAPATEEN